MHQCPSCSGFLPLSSTVCPNCSAEVLAAPSPKRNGSLGKNVIRAAIALGTSMTLMACYGGAVTDDGGFGGYGGVGGDGSGGATSTGGAPTTGGSNGDGGAQAGAGGLGGQVGGQGGA